MLCVAGSSDWPISPKGTDSSIHPNCPRPVRVSEAPHGPDSEEGLPGLRRAGRAQTFSREGHGTASVAAFPPRDAPLATESSRLGTSQQGFLCSAQSQRRPHLKCCRQTGPASLWTQWWKWGRRGLVGRHCQPLGVQGRSDHCIPSSGLQG